MYVLTTIKPAPLVNQIDEQISLSIISRTFDAQIIERKFSCSFGVL
jgi:hypothetical protein